VRWGLIPHWAKDMNARAKSAEIYRLSREGVGKAEMAWQLGVGERSVYRMLAESSDTSAA
jgi:hypothetical protein